MAKSVGKSMGKFNNPGICIEVGGLTIGGKGEWGSVCNSPVAVVGVHYRDPDLEQISCRVRGLRRVHSFIYTF